MTGSYHDRAFWRDQTMDGFQGALKGAEKIDAYNLYSEKKFILD
jgi:hypothetical protein